MAIIGREVSNQRALRALRVLGALLVPACVGLGACSTDDGAAPPDTETPDAAAPDGLADVDWVTSLCAAQAAWECKMVEACACPPTGASRCGDEPVARCIARLEEALGDPSIPTRIDPQRAAACVEAWSTDVIDCGPRAWARLDAACGPVLLVDVATGASCAVDGAACASGDGACVAGTCVELPRAGEACAPPSDDGAPACRLDLMCVGGRCQPAPIEEGAPCEESGQCAATLRCIDGKCGRTAREGEMCDARVPCRGATECRNGTCARGTPEACTEPGQPDVCGVESLCGAPQARRCEPLAALGAACADDQACVSGSYCDPVSSRCEALPLEGEACGDGVYCADGLACSLDTTRCAPAPTLGESCAFGSMGPESCVAGLVCVGGLCGEIPGEGEECGYGAVCAAGLGCVLEGTRSVCRVRRPAGGACDNDTICAEGTHCDPTMNQCEDDRPLGSPCMYGNECESGASCVPDASGALTCAPTPVEGEPCLLDCAPGLACVTRLAGDLQCFPSLCASLQ